MAYFSLPPVPVVTPADYVARAPNQAKPPQTVTEPKPSVSSEPTRGPAVIFGGSLAKPAERRPRSDADAEKPAPPPQGRHIDRII
jgi:hypothetical protein